MYRKRALAVESGPRRKVRRCRPAAKVSAAYVSAAEARSATAPEMGRTAANPHPATAEMTAAASTAMKSAATSAMKSAATSAMKSATAAAMKSAATATASSGTCVSGARESSRQDNNAENLDF
jgi:hypothetical protein